MAVDYGVVLGDLERAGMLPPQRNCVLVVGSLARGWANAASDVDVIVVTDAGWQPPGAGSDGVRLQPDAIATARTRAAGRRCDVKYWLDGQVDQLLAKVSWPEFHAGRVGPAELSDDEMSVIERLDSAVPLAGEPWLVTRREQLHGTAYRAVMTARALTFADNNAEDALGQLADGDLDSAVLSARLAFGWTVDALLCQHGELDKNPKWRARRLRAAQPPQLPFEEYWRIETMRTFDPSDPATWVKAVITTCRDLALDVSLG
jgi:hypothetical protein